MLELIFQVFFPLKLDLKGMVPGQVGVYGESAVWSGISDVGGQELASVPLQHMEANRVMGQQMREKPVTYLNAQVKQIWWLCSAI